MSCTEAREAMSCRLRNHDRCMPCIHILAILVCFRPMHVQARSWAEISRPCLQESEDKWNMLLAVDFACHKCWAWDFGGHAAALKKVRHLLLWPRHAANDRTEPELSKTNLALAAASTSPGPSKQRTLKAPALDLQRLVNPVTHTVPKPSI